VEYNNQMKNRIKRVEGQMRGVMKMVEEDADCRDVITQLSAARSAIDRAIGVIVSTNLVECMKAADNSGQPEEMVKEAVNLLVRSR
jgi:DNA-binding FrmR family transcriptional regulator